MRLRSSFEVIIIFISIGFLVLFVNKFVFNVRICYEHFTNKNKNKKDLELKMEDYYFINPARNNKNHIKNLKYLEKAIGVGNNFILNEIPIYIDKSKIEGLGCFAKRNIQKGEFICYSLYYINNDNHGVMYPSTHFNHCVDVPNTTIAKKIFYSPYSPKGEKIYIYYTYATEFIPKNKEIVCDYNKTPKFINKPSPNFVSECRNII